MTIRQGVSSAIIFAGVAVGIAGPAGADPGIFDGDYTYTGGGTTRIWHATSCGVGCSNIVAPAIPGSAGFSGQAQLAYGGFALTLTNNPDTVVCSDGSSAPGNITYRWNPGTMSGSTSIWTTVPTCGDKPKGYPSYGFTLAKVA